MTLEKTIPHPYLGQQYIGYVVNTLFSREGQQAIRAVQERYVKRFGSALFIPPPETLHITLMDWLAPLVDYGQDKDTLFEKIYPQYNKVVEELTKEIGSIAVRFNTIDCGPEAIFISGTDNGQYNQIRQGFLDKVQLLPNTKLPPQIIHSTIARFLTPVNLKEVQDFTAQQTIDFVENIDFFRLIRSTNTTMDKLKVIKRYELK